MTGKTRFLNNVSRRKFVAGASALGLGMGVAPFISRRAMAAGEVKVLNWQGYGTDEKWALDAFKAATGLDVVHEYYNSEAEMITKLQTNPGVYDVIVTASDGVTLAMARQRRDEARALIAAGTDPSEARKAEKAEKAQARERAGRPQGRLQGPRASGRVLRRPP